MTSCNGDAVTSRSRVLDHRKNETLDVVTSKDQRRDVYDNELGRCGVHWNRENALTGREVTWT